MAKKITDLIRLKGFTISAELVPPRNGTCHDEIYKGISTLSGKVDFVSVTRGAGGSLRGGSLPISYYSQERYGIPTIAHFVCRERTAYEIENELIDLHHFGINNILALRGDPPAGSNEPWDGDYRYAYNLVRQISHLNRGKYLAHVSQGTSELRDGEKTDFCIFVAGHPEDPIQKEIEHIKAKVDSGAQAIITQMVFACEDFDNYQKSLRNAGITIPIIAGIRPLTSLRQAESCERFFGIPVPKLLKDGLNDDKGENAAKDFGIRYTAEMISKLKKHGAAGAHLFVLNDVSVLHDILAVLQKWSDR